MPIGLLYIFPGKMSLQIDPRKAVGQGPAHKRVSWTKAWWREERRGQVGEMLGRPRGQAVGLVGHGGSGSEGGI